MPPAPDLPGPRLALVVTTANYTDPGFAGLRAPAQDAADMIEVLTDEGIGGFDVTPVQDRPEYEIRRAIDAFLSGRGVDDLVVVYLSCHGVLDPRGRLYFAAVDTMKTQLSSTAVESGWLLDRLEECRARRQVLILDCCFSGAFAQAKGGGGAEVDLEPRLRGSGRGRAILTASRAGEYSYEGDPLPGADRGRSVFTAALVDGLRTGEADRDRDGYVSVEDAFAYAADQVKAAGGAQSPQRWLYGAEGEIILARNPNGVPVTAAALPEALQLSLDSPYPSVRLGGVAELGTWLNSTDQRQVLAAHQALQLVASNDNPTVAGPARDLLQKAKPAEPPTLPAPATPATPPAPAVSPTRERRRRVPQRLERTIRASGRKDTRAVNCVAFDPTGLAIAVATDNGTQLWHVATGNKTGPLLSDGTAIAPCMVAFSLDGKVLASGCNDGTVRLWNVSTGRPIGRALHGHEGPAWAVAYSPDGKLLASGGDDHTVRLWDPATGRAVGKPLKGHTGVVRDVGFSPDGWRLASCGDDRTIRLWDRADFRPVGEPLTGHTAGVRELDFSPGGRTIVSAGDDHTVRLWTTTVSPAHVELLTGHTDEVGAVAFSPDGRLIASASHDRTVQLWDAATRKPVGHPLTGHTDAVWSVAFSPDGLLLASGGADGTVRLWAG